MREGADIFLAKSSNISIQELELIVEEYCHKLVMYSKGMLGTTLW